MLVTFSPSAFAGLTTAWWTLLREDGKDHDEDQPEDQHTGDATVDEKIFRWISIRFGCFLGNSGI